MATPPAHKDALDQAAPLIKQGDTAQGEQILRQILQADPNNVLALLWMTRCTEDPSHKAALFERILALDPAPRVIPDQPSARSLPAYRLSEQRSQPRLPVFASWRRPIACRPA